MEINIPIFYFKRYLVFCSYPYVFIKYRMIHEITTFFSESVHSVNTYVFINTILTLIYEISQVKTEITYFYGSLALTLISHGKQAT